LVSPVGHAPSDHLTSDIFRPPAQEEGLGRLDATLQKIVASQSIKTKFHESARTDKHGTGFDGGLDIGIGAGVIISEERDQILSAERARLETIQVDVFDPDNYAGLR